MSAPISRVLIESLPLDEADRRAISGYVADLHAEITRLRLELVNAKVELCDAPELNPRNFDEDDAFTLNDAVNSVVQKIEKALLPADTADDKKP